MDFGRSVILTYFSISKNLTACMLLSVSMCSIASTRTTYQTTGFEKFGPETSEMIACDKAKEQAKRNALLARYGEHRSNSTILACDSLTQEITGNDCDFFETTWAISGSEGFIANVEILDEKVNQTGDAKICTVNAKVVVQDYEGKADRLFETNVTMHEKKLVDRKSTKKIYDISPTATYSFKVRDKAVIKIVSTRPAYHYVFYWAPQTDKSGYGTIYPNQLDRQLRAETRIQIPSKYKTRDWDIQIEPPSSGYSTEFLIVVSSKEKLGQIPSKISEAAFYTWLNEKPRDTWTMANYRYRIIGDSK